MHLYKEEAVATLGVDTAPFFARAGWLPRRLLFRVCIPADPRPRLGVRAAADVGRRCPFAAFATNLLLTAIICPSVATLRWPGRSTPSEGCSGEERSNEQRLQQIAHDFWLLMPG